MATSDDVFENVVTLQRQRVPFALATVVRRRKPASGRPGDRAVVLADGSMRGWIGGSCAQPTIRREALRALADGKPRLVRLNPAGTNVENRHPDDDDNSDDSVVAYTMTCHSGGSLEVYGEPFVPPSRLVVVGDSPVARSLLALGPLLGFDTIGQPDPGMADLPPLAAPDDTWLAIATMGNGDEVAVEAALRSGAGYVALVASRRRASSVLDYLRGRELSLDLIRRLKSPAGLDFGATTPAEIAMSILAEIVSERRKRRESALAAPPTVMVEAAAATSIDPVCGMQVDIATARWTTVVEGQTIRFCAPGCKRTFLTNPAAFPST
jgi:xanthine dehydrogenase accessory factor